MTSTNITASRALENARTAIQKKNKQDAHYWSTIAIKEDPNLVDAWLILAAVSNTQDSEKYLHKVLDLDPGNKKALAGLKWVAEHKGTSDDVSDDYDTKQIPIWTIQDSISQSKVRSKKQRNQKRRRARRGRVGFRWQTFFAVLMCSLFFVIAVAAPLLAPPDDPENPSYYRQISRGHARKPEPPNPEAWLGTVDRHYDIYYSLIWGTRQSLIFGLSTAIITAILGTLIGTISAYIGGRFDNIVMRITDAFLSFPIISGVALFVLLQSVLSPDQYGGMLQFFGAEVVEPNIFQRLILEANPVFIALILFSWMPYARIIHTQVLEVKQTQYIDAANVVGVRPWRIIRKHIIPNAISPVIVYATRDIGRMVVVQATFTYINLGGESAWATLLQAGSKWIIGPGGDLFLHWWVYLPITLMLVLFGISWNFLGDELNVQMNPLSNGVR